MKSLFILIILLPLITLASYHSIRGFGATEGKQKESQTQSLANQLSFVNKITPKAQEDTEQQWAKYHQAYLSHQQTIEAYPPLSIELQKSLADYLSEIIQTDILPERITGDSPEEIIAKAEDVLRSSLEAQYSEDLDNASSNAQTTEQVFIKQQKERFEKAKASLTERYKVVFIRYFQLTQQDDRFQSPAIKRKDIAEIIAMPATWKNELDAIVPDEASLQVEAKRAAAIFLKSNGINPPRRPPVPVKGAGDTTGYQIALEEYQATQLPIYQRALQSYQNTLNNVVAQEVQKLKKNSQQTATLRNQYLNAKARNIPNQDWEFYLNQIQRVLMPGWDVQYKLAEDQSRQLSFQL